MLITVGGQEGDYPSKLVVSFESALEAATHYLSTKERHPGLNWEAQR